MDLQATDDSARSRRLISYADQPAGPDIAINTFPTVTVARQSFTLIDGSKRLSLRLRRVSSRCRHSGSRTAAAYCLSAFHYSHSSADDGEGKDYTSG